MSRRQNVFCHDFDAARRAAEFLRQGSGTTKQKMKKARELAKLYDDPTAAAKILNTPTTAFVKKLEALGYEWHIASMLSDVETVFNNWLSNTTLVGNIVFKQGLAAAEESAIRMLPFKKEAIGVSELELFSHFMKTTLGQNWIVAKAAKAAKNHNKQVQQNLRNAYKHGTPPPVGGTRFTSTAEELKKMTGVDLTTARAPINAMGSVHAQDQSARYLRQTIAPASMDPDSFVARAINKVGDVVNIPNRALMYTDLVGKLQNYNISLYQQALAKSRTVSTDPDVQRAAFQSLLKNPSDSMAKVALRAAETNTFTDDMGKIGERVRGIASMPFIRWYSPFVHTKWNIAKSVYRNSGLDEVKQFVTGFKKHPKLGISNEFLERLVANTPDGRKARADLVTSSILPGTMIAYLGSDPVVDGHGFTGAVDASTPEGLNYINNIAPAYSYKFKDGTVFDFSKIEPLRSVIGLMLNYKQAAQNLDGIDPWTGEKQDALYQLASITIAPFFQTIDDGFSHEAFGLIVDVMEAMGNNDMNLVAQKLAKVTSTFDPNIVSKMSQRMGFQESITVANNAMEELMRNLPGSKPWEGRAVNIRGEIVRPVGNMAIAGINLAYHDGKQTILDTELARLDVKTPRRPRAIPVSGLKGYAHISEPLTSKETEVWEVLRGAGWEGGLRPLADDLEALINSRSYRFAANDAQRRELLDARIKRRHNAARDKMLQMSRDGEIPTKPGTLSVYYRIEEKRQQFVEHFMGDQSSHTAPNIIDRAGSAIDSAIETVIQRF